MPTFARLLARAGAKGEGGVCVMIYLLMPTLTPRPTPPPWLSSLERWR
jgi:hypothetical protein